MDAARTSRRRAGCAKSGVFLLALLAASLRPARAESARFDGPWIIEATTTSFFCPVRSKELRAVLQDGAVTKFSGLPNATASGGVDRGGAVALVVKLLGHTARIGGKLSGAAGEGRWSADSILCGQGNWRAHR